MMALSAIAFPAKKYCFYIEQCAENIKIIFNIIQSNIIKKFIKIFYNIISYFIKSNNNDNTVFIKSSLVIWQRKKESEEQEGKKDFFLH